MKDLLHRLNPAVPKSVLPVIAGVAWGAVGIMLLTRSSIWFLPAERNMAFWISLAVGLAMAAGMIPGMFLGIVRKNLARLTSRPDRACLFSAFAWRSWVMVVVMSVGGGMLRRSDAPRMALAGPYLGMSLCLLAGSWLYLRHVVVRQRA